MTCLRPWWHFVELDDLVVPFVFLHVRNIAPRLSDISSCKFEPCSFMFCHRTTTANSASVLIPSIWYVHVFFWKILRPHFWLWHHTPHAILCELQIMQTSIGIDVRDHVGFCCYNPFCGGRKQLFESARALSLHLARSPACGQFANECDRTCNARKLSLLNAVIVVQSSKRPMPLRRDVVNDITHIEQHDCENEVCNDWSDFNFPNMYGNKVNV